LVSGDIGSPKTNVRSLAADFAGAALTARPLMRPFAKAARLKAWLFLVYPLRPGNRAERLSP